MVTILKQSDSINVSAVGEDLGSTKQRLGGQRIVKRCTRGAMFVDQTNHQFLARLHADQKEPCPLLPNLSGRGREGSLCLTYFVPLTTKVFKVKQDEAKPMPSFSCPLLFDVLHSSPFLPRNLFSFLPFNFQGICPLHICCIVVYIKASIVTMQARKFLFLCSPSLLHFINFFLGSIYSFVMHFFLLSWVYPELFSLIPCLRY